MAKQIISEILFILNYVYASNLILKLKNQMNIVYRTINFVKCILMSVNQKKKNNVFLIKLFSFFFN